MLLILLRQYLIPIFIFDFAIMGGTGLADVLGFQFKKLVQFFAKLEILLRLFTDFRSRFIFAIFSAIKALNFLLVLDDQPCSFLDLGVCQGHFWDVDWNIYVIEVNRISHPILIRVE